MARLEQKPKLEFCSNLSGKSNYSAFLDWTRAVAVTAGSASKSWAATILSHRDFVRVVVIDGRCWRKAVRSVGAAHSHIGIVSTFPLPFFCSLSLPASARARCLVMVTPRAALCVIKVGIFCMAKPYARPWSSVLVPPRAPHRPSCAKERLLMLRRAGRRLPLGSSLPEDRSNKD